MYTFPSYKKEESFHEIRRIVGLLWCWSESGELAAAGRMRCRPYHDLISGRYRSIPSLFKQPRILYPSGVDTMESAVHHHTNP
jgi:hypothetical protein